MEDEANPDMEVTDQKVAIMFGKKSELFTLVNCAEHTAPAVVTEGRVYNMSNVPHNFCRRDIRYSFSSGGSKTYYALPRVGFTSESGILQHSQTFHGAYFACQYRGCAGARVYFVDGCNYAASGYAPVSSE